METLENEGEKQSKRRRFYTRAQEQGEDTRFETGCKEQEEGPTKNDHEMDEGLDYQKRDTWEREQDKEQLHSERASEDDRNSEERNTSKTKPDGQLTRGT